MTNIGGPFNADLLKAAVDVTPSEDNASDGWVDQLIDALFMGKSIESISMSALMYSSLIHLSQARATEFQQALKRYARYLCEIVQNPPEGDFSDQETLTIQLGLNAVLSYWSYARPEQTSIRLPYLTEENVWEITEYTCEALPLTKWWLGQPCFAYGLTPEDAQAPALLLFQGTSFPADRGSWWHYAADLFPGLSVGKLIFVQSKSVIQRWITRQEDRHAGKIQAHGTSLGGALSMMAANQWSEQIKAWAYVPAGTIRTIQQGEINVIVNSQDFVSQIGHLPKNATCYHLSPSEAAEGVTAKLREKGLAAKLLSHATYPVFGPGITVTPVKPEFIENQPYRWLWNTLWVLLAIIFTPLLLALKLITMVLRPFIKLAQILLDSGQSAVGHLAGRSADEPGKTGASAENDIQELTEVVIHSGLTEEPEEPKGLEVGDNPSTGRRSPAPGGDGQE